MMMTNVHAKKNSMKRFYKRKGEMFHATRLLLDNFYAPFNGKMAQLMADTTFLFGAGKS